MASTQNEKFECNPKVLNKHIKDLAQKKKAIDEGTGSLRNLLKQVLETEGYHSKALANIRSIAAMSESGRRDFLRTYKPMFDAMYSQYWQAEIADMVDVAEGKDK